jgi:outer membrane protein OmpA-like peptidoglycan-associated protein
MGTNGRRIVLIGTVLVLLVVVGNVLNRGDDPSGSPTTDPLASNTIAAVREAETNAGVAGVQIEVNGDIVTLYGTVATTEDLTVAEAVARSVVGLDMEIDNQLVAENAVDTEAGVPGAATSEDITLQNRLSTLLVRNPIIFGSASAEIAAESIPSLDVLATELAAIPDVAVLIAGHTDSDGEEDANLALSQARAEAVLGHLVTAGIDAGRLTAQGFGEALPIADNVSQEGKAVNRRIEILVQT